MKHLIWTNFYKLLYHRMGMGAHEKYPIDNDIIRIGSIVELSFSNY